MYSKYKWCAVPECENTSRKSPNKLFVYVPHKKSIREKWLKLARRNPASVGLNSPIHFCEDHFDMPHDMLNYMEYHVMGAVSQIRMKADCVPTKFECQSEKRNQTIVVIKRTEHPYNLMNKETQESEQSSSSTQSVPMNENKVFCPKCNTDLSHTTEGIQQAQTKALIARVYHYLEQEFDQLKNMKAKLGPLSKFSQRTALATGVSESTVLEILQEEERRNSDKPQEPSPKESRVRNRLSLIEREEPAVKAPLQVIYVKALSSAIPMEVIADAYQHQQQTEQQPQRNIQSTQTRPCSSAERQKRYREKRKADKMNACSTFSQSNDVQPQQEQPQHGVQINKRQPQSNAERQRKYRKLLRERERLRQQMEDINGITVYSDTPHTSSIHQLQNVDQAALARKRHLNKQRQSRFRARQRFESSSTSSYEAQAEREEPVVKKVKRKNKIMFTPGAKMKQPIIYVKALDSEQAQMKPISMDVKVEPPDDEMNETQTEPVAEPLFVKLESVENEEEKFVKSQAQRQKEYRQRKKLENQREKKKPKTNAQRQQEFREKQRKKLIGATSDSFLARKKPDAERAKRYRENKKRKQKGETSDLNLARKKSNAERIKIYRDKLKFKKELSSYEDTDGNIEDVGQASCDQDEQAQMNPISMDVKVEPPDDEMNEQDTLDESSSSHRLPEDLDDFRSSQLREAEFKVEIEIGEEGFS